MALIQTKNLEKSYKTGAGETFVLRRIDLEVDAGDVMSPLAEFTHENSGPAAKVQHLLPLRAFEQLDERG